MTCHLCFITQVRSHALPLNQAGGFSAASPNADSVSAISPRQPLLLSEVCSLWIMSVSKSRWLICDSRWEAGKQAMAENGTSWTVTHICLFEVFAEHSSAWFPDKWKAFVQRHISFGAGNAKCTSLSFCIHHRMDKLDKPVAHKVGSWIISLIFSAC